MESIEIQNCLCLMTCFGFYYYYFYDLGYSEGCTRGTWVT